MKKIIFGLVILLMMVISCKSGEKASQKQKAKVNNTSLENPEVDITLAAMLSRIPGIHVRGRGEGAIIRVRGGSGSFISSNEPLFIVNDQIFQGGYSTIINSIDPTQVKTIELLKDIGSLSSYGSRGANGVIKIVMK